MPWLLALGVLVLALLVVFYLVGRASQPAQRIAKCSALFEEQRGELQAQFFDAAATSGKPRGLRWMECQWDDTTVFGADKTSGNILALVGVTVRFEAIEGGPMEGLPAVANLRNASAVFVFDQGHWHTAGRTIFNLNPDEAAEHFGLTTLTSPKR